MKERPILFSAPMVRPVLAGTKLQTRRVMKRQKENAFTDYTLFGQQGHADDEAERRGGWARPWVAIENAPDWPDGKEDQCHCPYALERGDQLWVRESFSGVHEYDVKKWPPSAWFKTDPIWYWADGDPQSGDWTKPKPGIHMPRWASRIQLEVTGLRIEQLQEISEADAIAEGVQQWRLDGGAQAVPHGYSERDYYRLLWEQINGAGSWDLNPWVWVVEFKRITS